MGSLGPLRSLSCSLTVCILPLGAQSSGRLGDGAPTPGGVLCARLERWGAQRLSPRGSTGAWEGQDGVVTPLSVMLPPQQLHSDWVHAAHAGAPRGRSPTQRACPRPPGSCSHCWTLPLGEGL